jgi:hypothetical protein
VRPDAADLAWGEQPAERARLEAAAVAWLERAAELAIARYELDEALALLHRAVELAGDAGRLSALWRRIGRANALKFDSEAFWAAMHTAIEVAPTEALKAEISGDLAFETLMRSGMWTERPATELVGPAVELALAHAAPWSATRARALVARTFTDDDARDEAAEARAIAERLGDPVLLAAALDAQRVVATAAGDYEAAWEISAERLELVDRIDDPDVLADIVQTVVPPAVATCRFEQARALAERNDELTRPLTPHHRVHGVAVRVELEELLGCWHAIRALEERVRTAVEANAGTPCTQNARALLICSIAAEVLGDRAGSARLEREADALGLPGRHVLDTPRIRLALLRGDRDRAAELLDGLRSGTGWYGRGHWTTFSTLVTEVDAAGLLGRADVLERLRASLVRPGRYVELLMLRAEARVHGDTELLDEAAAAFAALGLAWQAAQTGELAAPARAS